MAQLLDLRPHIFRHQRWEPNATPTAPQAPSTLRLLTWNTWFDRHKFKHRAAALIDELSWRAPDVVALQEVTVELLRVLVGSSLVRSRYQLSDVDGSTFERYGVLLLSRIPLRTLSLLPLPSQMGRRLLVASLVNGLCVATVHLESTSECSAQRATQLRIIQPYLKELGDQVVLMGDMNFAPESLIESDSIDQSFIDGWNQNRFSDPGYTVDSRRNPLRRIASEVPEQKRIDRVFVRCDRWHVQEISLVGTAPIDREGTFVSDHFGIEAVLEPTAVA
jgi:endonuclease/exonuclease/phosphatase family metal-dependent hydrolase